MAAKPWLAVPSLAAIARVAMFRSVWLVGADSHPRRYAVMAGASTLLVLYTVYALLSHTSNLRPLWCGADNRPSTSKFQALVWTVTVLFAYVYVGVFALRIAKGVDLVIGWTGLAPSEARLAQPATSSQDGKVTRESGLGRGGQRNPSRGSSGGDT